MRHHAWRGASAAEAWPRGTVRDSVRTLCGHEAAWRVVEVEQQLDEGAALTTGPADWPCRVCALAHGRLPAGNATPAEHFLRGQEECALGRQQFAAAHGIH